MVTLNLCDRSGKYTTMMQWWYNLYDVLPDDDNFEESVRNILTSYGASYVKCGKFDDYIYFQYEADMAEFLLKWG